MKITAALFLSLFILLTPEARAYVDDAHSRAMEAATDAVKDGFQVRQEYQSGRLSVGQQTVVMQQFFKGNQYWLWLGSDEDSARVSVHIYDPNGRLADSQSWQKGMTAAVRVVPKITGTYYAVITIESAKIKRVGWALAYGYK